MEGETQLTAGACQASADASILVSPPSASSPAVRGHAAAQQLPAAVLTAAPAKSAPVKAITGPLACAVLFPAVAGAASTEAESAATASSSPTGMMTVLVAGDGP